MGGPSAWGEAGHPSAGGEQLHCASLVSYTVVVVVLLSLLLSSSFFPCLNKLSLSQPPDFIFLFLSPIPEREEAGGANGCVVPGCRPD